MRACPPSAPWRPRARGARVAAACRGCHRIVIFAARMDDTRMNDATATAADFRQRLDGVAADIESLLDRLLGPAPLAEELARPRRLMDSMRYASLGGGKRLRPFLVVETAALFDAPRERALMAGAALECVHCYSL